jgi:chemosensory pili system protein ChpA (sensor histidine kinase/response regulator)
MNMDMDEFDIGPLTWVKGEVDNALAAARSALEGWNGEDLTPLKAAAAHLHQVYGALQIVDLQGVSLLTAAAEHLLADMAKQPVLLTRESAEIVIGAIDALKSYLDGLLAGAPHAELKLTPAYRAVVAQRGGDAPAPSELFFPNTDARPPKRAEESPLDATARAAAIRATRASYQRGLLQVLRNQNVGAGLALMDQAVRKVEELAPGSTQYSFWWTTAGLMDALKREAIPMDLWTKRLFGRIDLQMRRLMEGSRQLAQRLFNDVLYYIAQDAVPTGRSAEVIDLYQLRRYFPKPTAGLSEEMLPFIASLKDHLNNAKDHWIRYCGGRTESLEPFQQAAMGLFEASVRLPNQAMKDLARIIQAVAKRMPGVGNAAHNESLQVEMATALLLGQNAADHFESLGEEFKRQADTQAMRVQAATDPNFDVSTIPQVDLLDEISRSAQEKLLLAQVTHEIQANLHQVEESLDRFFRNAQDRGGLPRVPGLLKQILGALNILQQDVAAQLVTEAITRIGHFNEADIQIPAENLNWVAEALSTLGLYVDALRYGRGDPSEMKRLLATPEAKPQPKEESVEAQARAEAQRLREAVGQWLAGGLQGADREAAKGMLREDLAKLVRDAELVGDGELRTQADNLLKALESGPSAGGMPAADVGTGRVAPSEVAQRMVAASSEAVDQELLETYIAEANDVLAAVAVQVSRLNVSPYDTEAFTVVRRGFHTLKGSGRMVGLTQLAEPAWEVEQTLNQWLRDEKAPTPEMLSFLEEACNVFQVWVSELEEQGRVDVVSDPLVTLARSLRGEGKSEEASPPKPDAGASAEPSATAGEISPPPQDQPEAAEATTESAAVDAGPAALPEAETMVDLDGHVLPAELFHIFTAEAGQRLQDMAIALAEIARARRPSAWEAFIRAAHTLAGISRTTGFTPIAVAAHAVERWGGAWPDKTLELPENVVAGLNEVINDLSGGVKQILARQFPHSLEHVQAVLDGLHPPEPVAVPEAVAQEMDLDAAVGGDAGSLATAPAEAEEETLSPEGLEAAEAEVEQEVAALFQHGEAVAAAEHPPEAPLPARDDLDEQLLPIFLEEAEELLPRIGEALREWRATPDSAATADALKRVLHTLKGSARMAGAMTLGEKVHGVESRVLEQAGQAVSNAFLDYLEGEYDQIHERVERLKQGPDAVVEQEASELTGATETGTEAIEAEPEQLAGEALGAGAPMPAAPAAGGPAAAAPARGALEDDLRLRQALRLKSDVLDTLLNEAGEVAIARARIENVLNGYKLTTMELAANVDRLRAQLRELEIQAESQMRSRLSQMDEHHFDPLEFDRFTRLQEITRHLAESVNDVSTAQDNLLSGLTEADTALIQQSRMARTLQQELMRMRMVPLNSVGERLYRIVRQSAKETGRRAQMELSGGQTELDRTVLDKIVAPLEHLVRNAVAHGIEAPEARIAAGKQEFGEIRLSARQEGNEIVLTLADDGAGVDEAAVKARAVERGWLTPDQAITPEQVEAFLFRSGFSTAREVTELAGRGVGLDVVKNEIASIGGRVRLESQPGQGARFTIRLPLTLALTQVVLARAGDQVWALPANLVSVVREVKTEQIQAMHDAGYLDADGERYPLRTLAELVDCQSLPQEGRFRTVLLLKSGEARLALRVDGMEGNFEAVVKPIGPQLARIAGISGATVLGDGRVALILNPFLLAERAPQVVVHEEEGQGEQMPLVLVVDDSLTVRKITGRLLDRAGYRVDTAKDGVEALEKLEEELPDVMLLDIEMPRMDGFEVTQHVRGNPRFAQLPIIMITSRTADKHREHALELGVNTYMGKPYQEEELLAEVARLAGQHVTA